MRNATRTAVLLSSLVLAPALAQAGPPLLCFPIDTGGAPSLPWGSGGWNEPRADYDRSRLTADTAALLGDATPVLARMETLRRAVLYARTDAKAAEPLFALLRQRATRPGPRPAQALARFDLGYAIEAARQARTMPAWAAVLDRVVGAGREDGEPLVKEALVARGSDPEMEYAVALVGLGRVSRAESDAHLRRALAGARPGSPLARTLAAHRPLWGERVDAALASAH